MDKSRFDQAIKDCSKVFVWCNLTDHAGRWMPVTKTEAKRSIGDLFQDYPNAEIDASCNPDCKSGILWIENNRF